MIYYYKLVIDGYIISIGYFHNFGKIIFGEKITEEEYNNLKSIINNIPEGTETHYYALRADTLEYEMIERPEPIPTPNPTYTLDKAAEIIAQEVAANE